MSTAHHHSTVAPVPTPAAMPEREVDDLIYIISHDVRNSVRALTEIPQWIAEDMVAAGIRLDADLRSNLDMMTTHARRLDRMMHDLLVFSRIGRMQQMRENNLADVIENVLSQIALPRQARVETDLALEVLRIGERDVLTLLSVLLTNAIRHHGGETARIRVSSRLEHGRAVLEIEDDGPGIALEHRAQVLKPMQTLRPRDEKEGSGMGLAIAQKIMRTYDGDISIEDGVDGAGTRIVLRLPQAINLN